MGPYIPSKDSLLAEWASNFATLITAAPTTYQLTAGDAASIQADNDTFQAAYTAAVEPSTRTHTTVAAKDNARTAMLITMRGYAIFIRNNQGISDEDKVALGLTIPDLTPSAIPVPDTSPVLSIEAATPGQLTVKYADQTTPLKKKKPFGAIGLEIWGDAPATGAASLANAKYLGTFTKSPLGLSTTDFVTGRTLSLWGRWITRASAKGGQQAQSGPWSNPASFVVP